MTVSSSTEMGVVESNLVKLVPIAEASNMGP